MGQPALTDLWPILRRWWWVVVLTVIAATAGAAVLSQLQQPVYRSVVRLLVTPARPDAGQTIAAQNLVQQYSLLATSARVAEAVSARLELDLPAEVLQQKVRAIGMKDDLVVAVQVDDVSPTRARSIASALAEEFVQQQAERMSVIDPRDRIEISVASPPQEGARMSPNTRANAAAAAVLGLLAGCVLAWLLTTLDNTFRTPAEVERAVQLAVLGVIPRGSVKRKRS